MTSATAVRPDQIQLPADAASMSEVRHELRTYLNHIVGYAGLVLEQAEESGSRQTRRNAEESLQVAEDMTAAVSNLLRSLAAGDRAACTELINKRIQPAALQVIRAMERATAEAASTGVPAMAADMVRVSTACRHLMDAVAGGLRPPKGSGVNRTPGRKALPDGVTPPARRPARLLAVDDNPENLELFTRFATRRGHKVLGVRTGEQALNELELQAFDLIVLDIMLPGADGFEVLRRVKGSAARGVPVIVLSSLDDLASMVTCLRMGAEDFMRKPFNAEVLAARIDALLDRGRTGASQGHRDPEAQSQGANPHALSPREVEVLSHLAMGKSNREIGSDLFITENTVIRHVNHIFTKAGLPNRAAAGVYAARLGLADIGRSDARSFATGPASGRRRSQ